MIEDNLTPQQKIEMKLGEFFWLVMELRNALALERGGGSPLSREEYLKLDKRAKDALMGLDDVFSKFPEVKPNV